MLNGLKKIVNGVTEIVEPVNFLVTNLTPKNKEVAICLLEAGFTVKEIQDFVDVSRTQLDEFIELEDAVLKRIKEKA